VNSPRYDSVLQSYTCCNNMMTLSIYRQKCVCECMMCFFPCTIMLPPFVITERVYCERIKRRDCSFWRHIFNRVPCCCLSDMQLVYRKIMDREENPRCCSYNTRNNKCWRHFLKDYKIENFETAAVKGASDCITWLKSSPTILSRTTSFGFRWYDRHS
jgi:hypothetical protein